MAMPPAVLPRARHHHRPCPPYPDRWIICHNAMQAVQQSLQAAQLGVCRAARCPRGAQRCLPASKALRPSQISQAAHWGSWQRRRRSIAALPAVALRLQHLTEEYCKLDSNARLELEQLNAAELEDRLASGRLQFGEWCRRLNASVCRPS